MKLILIFFFSAIAALAQTPEWSRKYHTGSVTCLDFSVDGGKLLSGSLDSTVKLWDVFNSDTLKNYSQPRAVHSVQMNSTGEWFIASLAQKSQASYDKPSDAINFKIDLNTRVVLDSFVSPSIVYRSDFGFNWAYLIAASSNKTVLFKNDKTLITVLTGGFQVVSAGSGGTGESAIIEILNLDSLQNKSIRISDVAGSPTAFDISGNNKYLVYGGRDYHGFQAAQSSGGWSTKSDIWKCELYDFDSKKKINIPGLNEFIQDPNQHSGVYISKATPHNMVLKTTFTADSKKLLTANKAGSIHVRSVPDGIVIDSLGSQTSLATALAADLQERYYFSTHEDSTLRIWMPGVHNVFKRIPLQNLVTTIAVSPDSIHFATAHMDGTVSYWNIDSLFLKAKTDSVFTPAIILQPKSVHICSGNDVAFNTEGQSNFGEAISYQWRKDGKSIQNDEYFAGAQTSELKIENANFSHYGKYNALIITSKGDTNITNTATLTFETIFKIKSQTDSVGRAKNGQHITLIIQLSDTAKYPIQWYHDGSPISDGNKNYSYYNDKGYGYYSLSFNIQPEIHGGTYILQYWNQCDTVSSKPIRVELETGMSVDENPFKNTQLSAEPNPFKNSTTIRFSLEKPLKIKLAVTDIRGREIAVLKDEVAEIGEQNIVFKNEELPQGTYYITLSGEGVLKTIPVQIVR